MNLLFSINRTFIPLLLNCANSVLKNGGIDEYTVYVLHSDLEAEDMDAHPGAILNKFIIVWPRRCCCPRNWNVFFIWMWIRSSSIR